MLLHNPTCVARLIRQMTRNSAFVRFVDLTVAFWVVKLFDTANNLLKRIDLRGRGRIDLPWIVWPVSVDFLISFPAAYAIRFTVYTWPPVIERFDAVRVVGQSCITDTGRAFKASLPPPAESYLAEWTS